MEYMGHTQSSEYLTMPARFNGTGSPSQLFPSLKNTPTGKNFNSSYSTATPNQRKSQTSFALKPDTDKFDGPFTTSGPISASDRTQLMDLETIKVSPGFAATRNGIHTRYTPKDWLTSNQSNFCASDRVRGGAELMRTDAMRLCREMCDKTKKNQDESTKRLGDRLDDTAYWKKELQNELDLMIEENKNLEKMNGCIEKALMETEEPLGIAQQCLKEREMRSGIDLVHDDVEIELLKEVDNLKSIQEELRHHVHDAKNQSMQNIAMQRELEQDCNEKFAAMNRDAACFSMRNTSGGLQNFNGIERVDNTISDPETWVRYTCDKIQRSQAMRADSRGVRDSIQHLLAKQAESLKNQWNAVNEAFSARLREYMDAKHKLETHLAKVLQEIFDTEKSLELLKKCLLDKDAPLKVAQTRLMTRSDRPNMESCKDKAQQKIVKEVNELLDTTDEIKAKINEAEDTLQHLLRTKMSLEDDLSVKNNSIFIDRERCMGLRKSYNMAPRSCC